MDLNWAVSLYKKLKMKRNMRKVAPYVDLSKETHYEDNFFVDIIKPVPRNDKFLSIGKHGMIGGSFIFETSTGKITVGDRCHIGGGQFISRKSISIGNDVTIAWDVTLYDHNSHSIYWDERRNDTEQEYKDFLETGDECRNKDWSVVKSAPIVIKDKAWLGFGVTVLKGVTIGEGAVIGAKSVVTHDIPSWTVAAGNPASVVKRIEHE